MTVDQNETDINCVKVWKENDTFIATFWNSPPLILIILCRFFAEDETEMYQHVKRTCQACRVIVFARQTACFFAFSLPLPPSLFNPLSPNSDLSQISHCSIKGLLVRKVVRIENMTTQVEFT